MKKVREDKGYIKKESVLVSVSDITVKK